MANRRELEDQVARLTELVEEMRSRMAGLEGAGRPSRLGEPTSRRDLLRLGGAAALGAVGAAAMRVMPAAAANGDPVLAGQNVVSTSPTTITGANSPAEILGGVSGDYDNATQIANGTFSGAVQGLGGTSLPGPAGPFAEGVDGWAKGASGFGIYGLSDSGTGVAGESGIGIGLYARTSGRIRQDPRANPPMPVTGPGYFAANAAEQVRDATGALWLSSNISANPWRRATTFEVFPNPRRVFGNNVATPANTAVTVDATTRISPPGGPSGVPAGAAFAWCAVQSYEPCVLQVYPAGGADPGGGAFGVMGTAGISVQICYLMVPLSTTPGPTLGKFTFANRKTKARIFFDVWGYLTQS